MPTQVASNPDGDLMSRYSYLLQPIRDMTKNWDIDVATQLEEYLQEIEKIQISFDGGKTSMNFAEAALLIQGSACIYSKKVEYLYTLVYQTLDLIASKKRLQQAASVDENGQDKDTTFKEEDDFLSLDDIKEAKNIDLKEDIDCLAESPLIPRTPLALIPLGEKERQDVLLSQTGEVLGSRNDFKMNTCCIHKSGALILDLAHLSLLDNSFSRLPTSTPQQAMAKETISDPKPVLEEQVVTDSQAQDISMIGPGDNHYDDDDDGNGCEDLAGDAIEEHAYDEQAEDVPEERMQLRQKHAPSVAALSKATSRDPWELLDPHAPKSNDEKPFRKGRPFKLPPSILGMAKETKRKRKRTEANPSHPVLIPIHEFCAMAFHSHSSKFPKNPLKAPAMKEFEYLFWVEYRRRQELDKKQKKILAQYLTEEQFDELNAPDPDIDENEPFPQDDYGDIGSNDQDDDEDEAGGFCDPRHDDEQAIVNIPPMAFEEAAADVLVVSSYEDLVRKYVEGYLMEAQQYAQETDLSKRVRTWENKILPTLEEEEKHAPFDIHKYGEDVLHSFQEERVKPFAEIMKSKKPFEICRYFLATLQLANNYNVEISVAGMADKGVDTMSLKLLHMTPGHAGISSYRAPSVIS
ncbi:condensin-2 complex subunit H2 isoform X2 [Nematostella vectensis]|uniref:condensin-2 complex subunit H2 isoform X2 n=1 Tax=Nematostella vectensis TaxID=45351 RepID=UPI0020778346|nr:condensin-2 complex subunit H2 isoform X2 [Nematostella vectensis]